MHIMVYLQLRLLHDHVLLHLFEVIILELRIMLLRIFSTIHNFIFQLFEKHESLFIVDDFVLEELFEVLLLEVVEDDLEGLLLLVSVGDFFLVFFDLVGLFLFLTSEAGHNVELGGPT